MFQARDLNPLPKLAVPGSSEPPDGRRPRVRLEHGHRPGLCASVLGQFHSRSFVCCCFLFSLQKELEAPCGPYPLGVGVTGTEGARRLGPWEEKGALRRQEGHSRGGRVPAH